MNDINEPAFTCPNVASIASFISRGYAIPLDTAEHIVRRVLRMAGVDVEREGGEHDKI